MSEITSYGWVHTRETTDTRGLENKTATFGMLDGHEIESVKEELVHNLSSGAGFKF